MPFELRNALATFQWLMNMLLARVENCEAYVDDIVIYSSTWSEHMSTLREVFQHLEKASVTLNLVKCKFGKAEVTYLRKQVGQVNVRPLLAKVQAIVDFPVPEMRRQLCRILGMCGYYQGFRRNFGG